MCDHRDIYEPEALHVPKTNEYDFLGNDKKEPDITPKPCDHTELFDDELGSTEHLRDSLVEAGYLEYCEECATNPPWGVKKEEEKKEEKEKERQEYEKEEKEAMDKSTKREIGADKFVDLLVKFMEEEVLNHEDISYGEIGKGMAETALDVLNALHGYSGVYKLRKRLEYMV